jgi:PAS domain S-box-containing protein
MSSSHDLQNLANASPPADALRLVLETALDAVVVMGDDGIVAGWNVRAVHMFGWTREEAIGRALADLIIPERYHAAHRNGLQRYLKSGQAKVLGQRLEVSGVRKNGEEFPVELSIAPIRGARLSFVGFLRDLTERNTLGQARAEVARMSQRMAMSEMAASIVHEINQPLAAVAANADAGQRWLARERPDIEEARAAFKRIAGDARRANAIIEEIRLMFRHDSTVLSAVDVNAVIREVLALVRGDLENHRITVDTKLSDGLAPVHANPVQLRQVMVNLITNAIDALSTVANRQRLLRVGTQAVKIQDLETQDLETQDLKTRDLEPSSLLITVEDTGSGIDPAHAERIFEPFFSTKSHGMGMGLSICRSIVEHHGGRLSVAPGRKHGSIFQVTLPTAPPVAAEPAAVTR